MLCELHHCYAAVAMFCLSRNTDLMLKFDLIKNVLNNCIVYRSTLEFDMGTAERATIVANTLEVDGELYPDKMKRTLTQTGSQIKVLFESDEIRLFRGSVKGFLNVLLLSSNTILAFE